MNFSLNRITVFLLSGILSILVLMPSYAQIQTREHTPSHFENTQSISQEALLEIAGLKERIFQLSDNHKKLSTDLLQLVKPELLPKTTKPEDHANSLKMIKAFLPDETKPDFSSQVSEGKVYVYVYMSENFLTSELSSLPIVITDTDDTFGYAAAWIKVADLLTVAESEKIKNIRTVLPPVNRSGSVVTQGDAVHRTSDVRSTFSQNGTGINVGIISDGVTNRASSQATGDLPPDGSGLTVLSAGSGDEGTAMLEIVYDMAPGADLFFHDAGANTIEFNNAITNLVNAGCHIVCDDIGWIAQPFFEDGSVATHISNTINSNDIIYVTAAGNDGASHYQGDFSPVPGEPTQHDFSSGSSGFYYLYLNMEVGEQVIIILQWNDPFGGSGNDYDLYLYSYGTTSVVASSTLDQNGTQDPLEFIVYTRPAGGDPQVDYAIIVNKHAGDPRTLEVFIYAPFNYSNNITPVDAIFGHPAVDKVVSAGAVGHDTPNTIRIYSSQGPSTISHPSAQIRQTPKIVGVDGVSVTGAGGFPSNFFGTSAAAPHIVAILAQAWGVNPSFYTGEDIKQIMFDYPVTLPPAVFNNVYGYGRADALEMFNNSPLPVELTSFSASVINNSVQLNWKTATETNNYGFEIQRTIHKNSESMSAKNWKNIGFVEGYGNSNSEKNYSFMDNEISSYNKISYRLKQIDTDGKFAYSDEIEVDMSIPIGFALFQNYPNPFNPATVISWQSPVEGRQTLKIFDLLGREMITLVDEFKEAGNHSVAFDASSLSSGTYFYRVQAGEFTETKKMIIIR